MCVCVRGVRRLKSVNYKLCERICHITWRAVGHLSWRIVCVPGWREETSLLRHVGWVRRFNDLKIDLRIALRRGSSPSNGFCVI